MPQSNRSEYLTRLKVEVETWAMDVAAGLVAEVDPHMGLVGALVLGKSDVAIDPEKRSPRGAVVGDEVWTDPAQVRTEAPHELQRGILNRVEISLLVLREPISVVVLAQVHQEPEEIGDRKSTR